MLENNFNSMFFFEIIKYGCFEFIIFFFEVIDIFIDIEFV